MRRVGKWSPSPAMVVAMIALFFALGGGAVAAIMLPAGSVGTRQLKDGAVSGAKIQNGAVGSVQVKDFSLLARDFRPGQLPAGPAGPRGPRGDTGAAGPRGPKGDTGGAGAAGPPGAAGKTILSGSNPPGRELGAVGDLYIDTATHSYYGPKTAGGWGAAIGLVGPQGPKGNTGTAGAPGPPGAAGKTILSGSGAPDAALGAVGDLYIDTAAHSYYGPKTAGGWGAAISMIGPATGPAGGALSGSYPNPSLNVSNGPCAIGQYVTDVSTTAALSCGPTDDNTALGAGALDPSHGLRNTAVGQNALGGVSAAAGSGNTALGWHAGSNLGFGMSDNIEIGNEGQLWDMGVIRIGNQNRQYWAYLAGVYGAGVSGASVQVGADGQLGVSPSSKRFKTDVKPLAQRLAGLMKLNPVAFRYKQGVVSGRNPVAFGLLAEQVAKVYPNLVLNGPDGKPYTVLYQELPALLLAQIQTQQHTINNQKGQISALRHQLDWLMAHAQIR